ncbi:dipeptidyl aminopeptidase/acylaminoacyl peptidase [Actinocorallia herbida]|uniref:Dipeptidyl aminopeptidase/acylaminoacyl peptidase n=1 Tax=Actinocorallia herbida TaxID=58109 RepID=A0A3N1D686_9ACTN|nr:prolyl oligopeptidase family serine peptidase [Actinocorallia herbida]ROO88976.1 dipeptidyl aminopeptidase/acylaminoacyl peptidase [Actinocorallia herbida]
MSRWGGTADPRAAHAALTAARVPSDVTADGSLIAFTVPSDGGMVLHVLDADGTGGARPLPGTDHVMPRWIPGTGRLVAVTSDLGWIEEIDAATGAIAWSQAVDGAVEEVIAAAGGALLVRVADPGSDRDGMHLGLRVPAPDGPYVDSPGTRLRRLFLAQAGREGLQPVPLGGLTVWEADWDGAATALAVVSADPSPSGYYAPRLVKVDVRDGSVRTLLTTPWQLARPRLSPDGSCAVVVEGLSIVSGRVLRVDLASGGATCWESLDDVTDLGWLDAGRLWFAGWAGTGVQGGLVKADGTVVSRWTAPAALGGRDGQPSLVPCGPGRAVTVWDAPDSPPEVAVGSLGSGGFVPRTDFNAGLARLAEGLVREVHRWEADDGRVIEGLVLRPVGPGPFPLVVLAHGGPTWLWAQSFAPGESNLMALPLALAGAAVLLPNPRGSSGRGQEHARAVIGDFGGADLADLLAGADLLICAGIADPDRQAIAGLSYGGYLTARAITRTGRFQAAVVMSGVPDWVSFRTTSAIGGGYDVVYHGGADPATLDGREFLADRSPLYAADSVTTPTLILHGAEDRVTTLGEAERLYKALVRAGTTVEMVTYPHEGHELTDPANCADARDRILGWLTGHGVLTSSAAPTVPAGDRA